MSGYEATVATVHPVARPRGDLTETERAMLVQCVKDAEDAQDHLRRQCLYYLRRSSFRAVSEATGFSTNTLQRWRREAGK